MKLKKLKYFLIFPLIFIILLFSSCTYDKTKYIEFDKDINVYTDNVSSNNVNKLISFDYICDIENNDDNVLIISYNLDICNKNRNNKSKIKLSDPKAYGNDIELEEEVLYIYDSDNKNNTVIFDEQEYVIDMTKKAHLGLVNINFYLVIKDGNPDCKYRVDFKFNNVKLSVYSYDEGYELDKFMYVHNPSYLDSVLVDAEYDSNAVFGYKPNNTGSLKTYADYDWCDEEKALEAKANRLAYINENDRRLKALETTLRNQNKTIEEIARACSNLRNNIRIEQYNDDPVGLADLKQRNLDKYGHEEGPLPDELYEKYGSWEIVLEKCYSVNRAMDACCGIYDMFYYFYNDFAY